MTPQLARAASAEPIGIFRVEGINPGGQGTYSGTVRVRKMGATFDLAWTLQGPGQKFFGTGILAGGKLAVAYTNETRTWFGVAFFEPDPDGHGWVGIWSEARGEKLGAEKWKPV